jgi:nucleotide-binding universal stress UspA family protein
METNVTSKLRFKTIAVATDLSDAASAALRYARAMALVYQAELLVVHVTDPVVYAFSLEVPSLVTSDSTALGELKKIEQETRAMNITIRSVVGTGIACDRILEAVRNHHADLLVLGTKAKTEVGRIALGTVARQLLAKAHCPILTISPDALESLPWAGCWRRVIAGTDFSPASIRALRCAHQAALRQLILLHVCESLESKAPAHLLEILRFLAPFNESHTVPVEHIVTTGPAGPLIAKYAKRYGADLVVLGSPENELTEKDFATSTVVQVIAEVKCAVLCLPNLRVSGSTTMKTEVSIPAASLSTAQ